MCVTLALPKNQVRWEFVLIRCFHDIIFCNGSNRRLLDRLTNGYIEFYYCVIYSDHRQFGKSLEFVLWYDNSLYGSIISLKLLTCIRRPSQELGQVWTGVCFVSIILSHLGRMALHETIAFIHNMIVLCLSWASSPLIWYMSVVFIAIFLVVNGGWSFLG